MENYKSLSDIQEVHFKSCEGCETPCCDGKRFYFIPLILEDFVEVYKNFAIVFTQINSQWRMLMILSKDSNGCAYFKEGKCSIYSERPPGCYLYPLTPYYEDILIDMACPAINENAEGDFFANQKTINSDFYHKRLENFNDKRLKSEDYLQSLNQEFESLGFVNGIEVFGYAGSRSDSYLQMHRESLRFF